MSKEIKEQLVKLYAKRRDLIGQLTVLDKEIHSCRVALEPQEKKISRQWCCSCGLKFDFYFDRTEHLVDNENRRDLHHADGEIIDGKHIIRDGAIVGDPIAKKQSAAKWDANAPVDLDDLA